MAKEFKPTDEKKLKLDEQKPLGEFEKDMGVIFHDKVDLNKKITRSEFLAMLDDDSSFTWVTHDDRAKWLEQNGYEVTRKNMITDLPSKASRKKRK